MTPRILVLEEIHNDGLTALEAKAKVDVRLGLDRQSQLNIVDGYDAIVVRSVVSVDRELLDRARTLKAIGRAGTGTENIDLVAAAEKDISVFTVPTGNSISAAEFTIALMFCLTRHLPQAFEMAAAGDFRRNLLEGREFSNLSVGLVGLGNVGMAVATRLAPFGSKIYGVDPEPRDRDGFAALGGITVDTFSDLLPLVDILSFHVRVTDQTVAMLNEEAFAAMKPGMFLVNTSRAHVIDDEALLNALDTGQVAAAALDVLDPEPPFDADPGDHNYSHPLSSHPRVLATPHMAASTTDAQYNIGIDLARQLIHFFNI
jgi:D-3-phosphoglycerate dehydrogenase / 2-oxoglutarate reductase